MMLSPWLKPINKFKENPVTKIILSKMFKIDILIIAIAI